MGESKMAEFKMVDCQYLEKVEKWTEEELKDEEAREVNLLKYIKKADKEMDLVLRKVLQSKFESIRALRSVIKIKVANNQSSEDDKQAAIKHAKAAVSAQNEIQEMLTNTGGTGGMEEVTSREMTDIGQDWDKSKKSEDEEYGKSNLEVLHEDLLRIIFKMINTEDLKAVRLSSSTMRRRVWECEDIRFKHWELEYDRDLCRLSEEVTIIKDLTVRLEYVELEDFISSMRSTLERHQEIESLSFIFRHKDIQFISETTRYFGHIIRSMEFVGCSPPNLEKENFPSLEGLGFCICDLTDQEFKAILQEFGDKLVQLKLNLIRISAKIWKSLPKLTELEITGLSITSHELSKLLSLMPNMQSLKLSNLPDLIGEGISIICKSLPKLTSVDLSLFTALTDVELSEILSIMPNIKSLKLPRRSNLTGEGISRFCKSLPKLTSIDLGSWRQLTDSGLSEFLSIMPNIHSLKLADISNLTGEGISRVCKPLPKLTSIDLVNCSQLTDSGLSELLSIMPNIQSLKLYYGSNVTGEGISRFCKSLLKVATLELVYLTDVTDHGLSEILSLTPNLQKLNLANVLKLSGEGVKSICKSLPKLTELDISQCKSLAKRGLSEILSLTPNLESLCLPFSIQYQLSGGQMAKILQSIPQLTTLDLRRCENLADYWLKEVFSVLPNIKNLKLGHFSGLSNQYIDDLRDQGLNINVH